MQGNADVRILKFMGFVGSLSLICCLFSGCAPSAPTRITSEPPGAMVTVNGEYLGHTPVSAEILDDFANISTYTFSASKGGYLQDSVVCQEKLWQLGPGSSIPPHIHFDLNPVEGSVYGRRPLYAYWVWPAVLAAVVGAVVIGLAATILRYRRQTAS